MPTARRLIACLVEPGLSLVLKLIALRSPRPHLDRPRCGSSGHTRPLLLDEWRGYGAPRDQHGFLAREQARSRHRRRDLAWRCLWLAGNGMRMTILAVPPLIPLIHDEFRMSETEVGILAGLPVVLFACAAVPGSLLIARFGALATVIAGLVITALGSALRGAAPDVMAFYAATIVTGFGVAIMQPAMPPLVRAWLPERIGFATAVYANGLLIGEILPVSLMLPRGAPPPRRQLAARLRGLGRSPASPSRRLSWWRRHAPGGGGQARRGRAAPALWWPSLEQRPDVAARPDARRRQLLLLHQQPFPARLSQPDRPRRPGRARSRRPQYRPIAGVVPAAAASPGRLERHMPRPIWFTAP